MRIGVGLAVWQLDERGSDILGEVEQLVRGCNHRFGFDAQRIRRKHNPTIECFRIRAHKVRRCVGRIEGGRDEFGALGSRL